MIEAQIICSNPCDIQDLGLMGLQRGEERWVSLQQAQMSADLRKEQAKGNVRVFRKARRMEPSSKRPAPPFVAASRPQQVERPSAEPVERRVEIETVVRQEVDTEKLKAELLGDLLPGLRAIMAEELAKSKETMQASLPAPPQTPPEPAKEFDAALLENTLERVVRRVMPSGGVAPSEGRKRSGSSSDEPLYIPTEVVKKDAKARIAVKSKESEGTGDLDDAQKALRALKRSKKDNE